MKYTGITYRPPPEANTLLLQVTQGCAHNKCTFCTMYKNEKFKVEKMEQIEKDLQEAQRLYGSQKRIFLVNGDAFVLGAKKLKKIANKIIEYFPQMETITMYASIRNIMTKTDEELKELKEHRINDLWVGVETGNDEVLKSLNKGYSTKDAYTQLKRLNKVGIKHNCILMMGSGGAKKGIEVARDTAKLISVTKPELVGMTSLGFFEGSQLTEDMKKGKFIPANELEILEEQKELITHIEIEVPFTSTHPINAVNISGFLPQDKKRMIETIDHFIETADKSFLEYSETRTSL